VDLEHSHHLGEQRDVTALFRLPGEFLDVDDLPVIHMRTTDREERGDRP
jgi:hypothetical protein